MKKWLSILGTIGLTTTSTTTLINCENPNNNKNGGGNKPEPKPEPEKPQEPPIGSNWKLIDYPTSKNKLRDLFKNPDNKWYIAILSDGGKIIRKFQFTTSTKLVNNGAYKGLPTELVGYYRYVYRWNGVDEPQIPEINNGGKITDWKG